MTTGCAIELTENVRPEPQMPYSTKQWQCLIDNINIFLACGRTNGCGDFPPLEDLPHPAFWNAQQVHDILEQIQPEIMGERPTFWTRNWLDRVVLTLRTGWPGCAGLESCVIQPFGTEVDPTEFLHIPFVEWRHYAQYRAIIDQPIADPSDLHNHELKDTSLWYSHTAQQMVIFDDLIESDFFFTDFDDHKNRFPESAQNQNNAILAALTSMAQEPTPEAYEIIHQLSPHAMSHTYLSTISSFGEYRSWHAWHSSLAPAICEYPPQVTNIRVPATFKDICDEDCPDCTGNGCIRTLSPAAQILWALRWSHLQHRHTWSVPDEIFYRIWFLENTGLYRGFNYFGGEATHIATNEQLGQLGWMGGTQIGTRATQWNYQGHELRLDYGYNPTSYIIARAPFRPSMPPAAAAMLYGSGIGLTAECQDEWHY